MSAGRIPTTANSPLTVKGDLFTFSTGSAKLAVGANDTALVADSTQSTGLAYKTKGVFNGLTTTGDTIYSSSGTTQSRLGIGSTGQVLTVASGVPSWATPASGTTFSGAQAKSDSVSFSYTSNVATLMTFSTENFDTNSFHSTSSNTGRLTIPSGGDGKYLFAVDGISMGTVPGYVFIRLLKNGTVFGGGNQVGAMFAVTTGNNNAQASGSIIADAVAGDYFEVTIQSDQATGTVNLVGLWSCAFLGA